MATHYFTYTSQKLCTVSIIVDHVVYNDYCIVVCLCVAETCLLFHWSRMCPTTPPQCTQNSYAEK